MLKVLKRICVDNDMFILRGHFLTGMHLPGCLSGLQLHLSTVTADPHHNLFHCPLPGGLREDNTISLGFTYVHVSFTQLAICFRFKWLHDSFEIVLEVEKLPLPEVQPRFSSWTFGHLSSPCGALRWPLLSCVEAPKITKEKKIRKTNATRL